MTSVEDRLRAATRAAADTVAPESAPPLRLPRSRIGLTRPHRPARWYRTSAPLAAAAAVIAVVAVSLVVTGGTHARRPAASSNHASVLAGLPPYYVVLAGRNPLVLLQRQRAVVRATATGAVVATVIPPAPDDTFTSVTGAGSGHTFVLAAQKLVTRKVDGGVSQQGTPVKFFLLRIGPAGRAQLSALPIPDEPAAVGLDSMALSPDGRRLAVVTGSGSSRSPSRIQVFTVATGSQREWTWAGGGYTTNDDWRRAVLSWADGGRTLAFQLWRGRNIYVGVFDTAAPGAGLQSSTLPVEFAGQAVDSARGRTILNGFNTIITPDGTKIACATTSPWRRSQPTELGYTEFSASTGQVVRVLDARRYQGGITLQTEDVLWTSASGGTLIV